MGYESYTERFLVIGNDEDLDRFGRLLNRERDDFPVVPLIKKDQTIVCLAPRDMMRDVIEAAKKTGITLQRLSMKSDSNELYWRTAVYNGRKLRWKAVTKPLPKPPKE